MVDQETLKEFDLLYESTYFDVSKYVVCKCSKPDDVEDILQNIYLAVFKAISKNVNVTKEYILGIAKNKVKDYYRFNYKEKIISLFSSKDDIQEIDIPDVDTDIEASIMDKYDTELVWEYLRSKKVEVFKVFYMYFNLNLTIKEISKCLSLTESNVKHYLYRTIRELKNKMESESDENV